MEGREIKKISSSTSEDFGKLTLNSAIKAHALESEQENFFTIVLWTCSQVRCVPPGTAGPACSSSLCSSGGTWVPPVKYHFLAQVILSDHIMGDLFLLPNVNFAKSRGIRWGQQERTFHRSNNETDLVVHAHVVKKKIPSGKNHLIG